LNWKNRTWSIGPNIPLPIFKGRQLQAKLQQAKARFEELDATYRNRVLLAFGEVEDALTDVHMRAQAAEAQTKAVAAAREYLRLTHLQYQTGIIDYLHVVNAEQTLLSNEIAEAQLLNQRMTSTVLLIKALGGGWDVQSKLSSS
jgi:multidrug efflux system outer membrane protein